VIAVKTACGCLVGVARQFTLPYMPLLKPWQSAHNVSLGHGRCLLVCVLSFPGRLGYQYGTQKYALDRWQLRNGGLLRKTCKRNLHASDFVWVMIKDGVVKNLVG